MDHMSWNRHDIGTMCQHKMKEYIYILFFIIFLKHKKFKKFKKKNKKIYNDYKKFTCHIVFIII